MADGFLQIPRAALALARGGEELLTILRLYQQADAENWEPIEVSSRWMQDFAGLSARRCEALFDGLVQRGFVAVVDAGGRRRARRLRVVRWTELAEHRTEHCAEHRTEHNSVAPTPAILAAGTPRGTQNGTLRGTIELEVDELKELEIETEHTLSNSRSSTAPSARPTWASKLKLPKAVDRDAFVAVVLKASEALMQQPINPERCSGNARQVRILWESVGSPPLDELERLAVLLAEAAHRCPAPEFAREIRAEGWVDGTNRATFCGNVWRTRPPQNSGGADTERRIEVAEAWHEAGRPEYDWPPQKPNKGHNGRKPAHRHAIAGREYPFEVVELEDGRKEARRYRHTLTPDCELWEIRDRYVLEREVVSG